jgi:hypothetical protein
MFPESQTVVHQLYCRIPNQGRKLPNLVRLLVEWLKISAQPDDSTVRMNKDRKVVDIAEYAAQREIRASAPAGLDSKGTPVTSAIAEVRRLATGSRTRFTPVSVSGVIGLVMSLVFLAYIAVRAAEVGVLDGVVLTIVALDLAFAAASLGMIRVAPKVRSLATRSSRNRVAALAASEPAELVSIEDVRQRRASEMVTSRCPSCGAVYELVALDGSCPACGDMARSA